MIDTGPYARVRHPMYSGAIVLWIGIPLSLDEEAFLSEQLPGYDAYRRRVRHRLIPGVW